jgi:hypothetical protein
LNTGRAATRSGNLPPPAGDPAPFLFFNLPGRNLNRLDLNHPMTNLTIRYPRPTIHKNYGTKFTLPTALFSLFNAYFSLLTVHRPVPKTISGKSGTGTKQYPGHAIRLLNLLWKMITLGRPVPINSVGKNTPLKSMSGTGIAKRSSANAHSSANVAFVFERPAPWANIAPTT